MVGDHQVARGGGGGRQSSGLGVDRKQHAQTLPGLLEGAKTEGVSPGKQGTWIKTTGPHSLTPVLEEKVVGWG